MSPRRKISLIAAVPLGLAAIVFGLACLPSVQTWAARRALAGQADTRAELGELSVGWSGATITGLVIEQPGLKLTLPSAEIDLPVLAAARGRVDISRLVARGWTVELTEPAAPAAKPSAKTTAPDPRALFDSLRLPVALSLAQLDVQGRVRQPSGDATVALTGGGLDAGREGRFEIAATFVPADPGALSADKIDVAATVTARLRDEHTLDRLALDLTATTNIHTLRAKLDSRRDTNGADTHALSVIVGDHLLADVNLALAAGSGQATGTWKLDARDRDLAPFLPGRALPAFAALGEGRFSSDPQGLRPEVAGTLRVALSELQHVSPGLAAVGEVKLGTTFELALAGDQIAVRTLKIEIAGDAPVLDIEALQPFTIQPATLAMQAKEPLADAARIALTGLPSAWLQPWLGGDLTLTGGTAKGEWRVTMEPDAVRIRPVAALTMAGIHLDQAGEPLLRAVDLSLALAATRRGDAFTAELLDLSASSGGHAIFKLKGQGGPSSAKAVLEADLPTLLAQPLAGGAGGVVAGRIQADIDFALSDGWRAVVNLTVGGLRSVQPLVLPEIAATFTASGDAAGALHAEMPLTLSAGGRRSDLLLKADLTPAGGITRIAGSISGDLVHVQDLQVLGGQAPTEPSAAAPAEGEGQPVATAPFWAGYEGTLTLAIKRLVYAPGVESDLHGELTIDREAISLGKLNARLAQGGELSVTGRLQNEPAEAEPYALSGELSLTGFDPGPFLKPDNSRRPPVLEGTFDVKGTLSGRASDPAELADTALGRIDVTGRQGTLRALGVKVETAANLARPASALLGILGASTGNEDMLKYAERARAGAEVTKELSEVAFDRLDMTLQRENNNDLAITSLVMQAPMVRLTGGGGVKYQPGVPLLRQPLNVQLNLAARDRLARGLSSLKLLGAEADAAGFFPLTESIKLDGSLAEVGTSQLERLIRRALTQ
ncbi:MAG: hypothetical protein ABII82_09135 [Verrucomicrobiota bacterium]